MTTSPTPLKSSKKGVLSPAEYAVADLFLAHEHECKWGALHRAGRRQNCGTHRNRWSVANKVSVHIKSRLHRGVVCIMTTRMG